MCVCVIDTFFSLSPIINNGCYNPKRLSPLLLCTRVIFFFHIIQSIPIDTVLPNKKRGASGGGWGGARTGHSVYTHSCDRWVMAVVVIIHHPIYIYIDCCSLILTLNLPLVVCVFFCVCVDRNRY